MHTISARLWGIHLTKPLIKLPQIPSHFDNFQATRNISGFCTRSPMLSEKRPPFTYGKPSRLLFNLNVTALPYA